MKLSLEETLGRAMLAHSDGRAQEAERLYRLILDVQPKHSDANHNLGVLTASTGNFDLALSLFKIALEANPNAEQFWVSYINTLVKLGRVFEARTELASVVRLGLKSDKVTSLMQQLNPSTNLDFFYGYLKQLGIFNTKEGEVLNGESEAIPLLTNSFLNWFETQKWESLTLLELGSGSSTIYFSKFFEFVESYETNWDWYNKVHSKISKNVNLKKVDNIANYLKTQSLGKFDVILIDAGENRAKLARTITDKNFDGVIFFDNSEWYRQSIEMFIQQGFLEIPFFGIKPVEDWVSATSILAKPLMLQKILNVDWQALPKLHRPMINDPWDDENS